MCIALLIIDLQKEYFKDGRKQEELTDALEYVNETAKLFREADKPVVIVQHTDEDNKPGSAGFDVVDGLEAEDSDYRIVKTYSNAFWKTELEELLKEFDVEYVVCCGYAASHCVLSTYNGARERDFTSALLQRGIIGLNKDDAEQEQLRRDVVCYHTVKFMLEKL